MGPRPFEREGQRWISVTSTTGTAPSTESGSCFRELGAINARGSELVVVSRPLPDFSGSEGGDTQCSR